MRATLGALVLAALLPFLCALARPAAARSDDLGAAQIKYGMFYRGSLVLNCMLCHQREEGGGRLNPYGEAYRKAGHDLAAFDAIQYLDSDSDGSVNLYEFRLDTFPGDAESAPRPDEYHRARLMDWKAARIADTGCFPGFLRAKPSKITLTDRAVERIERAVRRPLTPYERRCLQIGVRAEGPERQGEINAGAVYLIDTAGPNGPMQVVVFVSALLRVAGVDVAFHNEPSPPPEESPVEATPGEPGAAEPAAPAGDAPEEAPPPAGADEGGGSGAITGVDPTTRPIDPGTGAIVLTGEGDPTEIDYPVWVKRLAFEQPRALRRFTGWSLDNEPRWAEDLAPLIEDDPDHKALYDRVAEAVKLALWLAEETQPRATVEGEVGSVRHTLEGDL